MSKPNYKYDNKITISHGHASGNYRFFSDKFQVSFFSTEILYCIIQTIEDIENIPMLIFDGYNTKQGVFVELKSTDDQLSLKQNSFHKKIVDGIKSFKKNFKKISKKGDDILLINKYWDGDKYTVDKHTITLKKYEHISKKTRNLMKKISDANPKLSNINEEKLSEFITSKLIINAYTLYLDIIKRIDALQKVEKLQKIAGDSIKENPIKTADIIESIEHFLEDYDEIDRIKNIIDEKEELDEYTNEYLIKIVEVIFKLGFFGEKEIELYEFAKDFRIPIELCIRDNLKSIYGKVDLKYRHENELFSFVTEIKREFKND